MSHFIPAWDWFVDTETGKKLLAENPQHAILIRRAFSLGFEIARFNIRPACVACELDSPVPDASGKQMTCKGCGKPLYLCAVGAETTLNA